MDKGTTIIYAGGSESDKKGRATLHRIIKEETHTKINASGSYEVCERPEVIAARKYKVMQTKLDQQKRERANLEKKKQSKKQMIKKSKKNNRKRK